MLFKSTVVKIKWKKNHLTNVQSFEIVNINFPMMKSKICMSFSLESDIFKDRLIANIFQFSIIIIGDHLILTFY